MGTSPCWRAATLASSVSTQTTSFPESAKQVPATRPTYPVPTTHTFMAGKLSGFLGFAQARPSSLSATAEQTTQTVGASEGPDLPQGAGRSHHPAVQKRLGPP